MHVIRIMIEHILLDVWEGEPDLTYYHFLDLDLLFAECWRQILPNHYLPFDALSIQLTLQKIINV